MPTTQPCCQRPDVALPQPVGDHEVVTLLKRLAGLPRPARGLDVPGGTGRVVAAGVHCAPPQAPAEVVDAESRCGYRRCWVAIPIRVGAMSMLVLVVTERPCARRPLRST